MLTGLIALGLAAQAGGDGSPEWMVGDWRCHQAPPVRSGPVVFEEYWVPDRRGGLVGVGRMQRWRTRSLEHMRIAPDETGRLTFYGAPNGAAPVAFPLVRSSEREAVFENPEHDFPQRIAYRREAGALVATVSRIDGGDAQTWRYTPIRGTDPGSGPCETPD